MPTLLLALLWIASCSSSIGTKKQLSCKCCVNIGNLFSGSKSIDEAKPTKGNQIVPDQLMTINKDQVDSPKHFSLPQFTPPSWYLQNTPSRTITKSLNLTDFTDLWSSMRSMKRVQSRSVQSRTLSPRKYHTPRNTQSESSRNPEYHDTNEILAIFTDKDEENVMHVMNTHVVSSTDVIHFATNFIEAKNLVQANFGFDGIFVGPSFTESQMDWLSFLIWLRRTHETDCTRITPLFTVFVSKKNQYIDAILHDTDPGLIESFALIRLNDDYTATNADMIFE